MEKKVIMLPFFDVENSKDTIENKAITTTNNFFITPPVFIIFLLPCRDFQRQKHPMVYPW